MFEPRACPVCENHEFHRAVFSIERAHGTENGNFDMLVCTACRRVDFFLAAETAKEFLDTYGKGVVRVPPAAPYR